MSSLIEYIRNCPLAEGADEITLPGDPERATLKRTSAEGISFDEGNWAALLKLADELGVAAPAGASGK